LFFPKKSIELSRKHSDFDYTFQVASATLNYQITGCTQLPNYRTLSVTETPNDKKIMMLLKFKQFLTFVKK
jgi:hypothetical protein